MSNLKEQLMIYSCNDCDGDGIKYCPYKKEDSHDKYCQRPKTFAEDMLRIFEYNNYYPIRADSEGLVKMVSPCEICEYNCPQEKKGICVTYRDYTNKMQLLKAQKALYAEIKDVIKDACQFQLDEDQLVVNKLRAERDAAIYKVGRLSRELGEQDFRIADLERINEAHHKENDRLNKRIKELEELMPTREEAEALLLALESYVFCLYGNKKLPDWAAKLQKIIGE